MPKPILPDEQFADMQYPVAGLDLSPMFAAQQPGTTRVGENVRAYDVLGNRRRGGSRPGLARYINGQAGGTHLIQHLNYVVDPQAQALPDYDPPGDITGGPNDGLGPDGDGSYPDPTGPPRDTSARRVRFGGTGIRMSRKRKNSEIRYVQGIESGVALAAVSKAFAAAVTKNDLVLVSVNALASTLLNTVTVSDSRGNTWARAGNYSPGTNVSTGDRWILSLWYAVANSSGDMTVTATSSDPADTVGIGMAEYSGTKTSGVFDSASTNTEIAASGPTYTATTGSVAVASARSMVVGVFTIYDSFVNAPISPYTGRTIAPFAAQGTWQDHIGASGAEAATRSVTIAGAVKFYVAVGASFKPRA